MKVTVRGTRCQHSKFCVFNDLMEARDLFMGADVVVLGLGGVRVEIKIEGHWWKFETRRIFRVFGREVGLYTPYPHDVSRNHHEYVT